MNEFCIMTLSWLIKLNEAGFETFGIFLMVDELIIVFPRNAQSKNIPPLKVEFEIVKFVFSTLIAYSKWMNNWIILYLSHILNNYNWKKYY